MTTNSLVLIRHPDNFIQRLGGVRAHRSYSLWINGVFVEQLNEDSWRNNYATGVYLDRFIDAEVKTLEKALRTKCVRGVSKLRSHQMQEKAK